jgi:hypothetical protein
MLSTSKLLLRLTAVIAVVFLLIFFSPRTHWPNGESYVWLDETDANPIPNSIYNNESGFTHDYYSGTTASADQPTRRLGVTPEAWMFGGPVTKPGLLSSGTPPAIACSGT